MCFWIFKKKKPAGEALLSVKKVIDELEYDIEIHETYAGLVVQNPTHYPPSVYGGYDWHVRWIEVYRSAIYHLGRVE